MPVLQIKIPNPENAFQLRLHFFYYPLLISIYLKLFHLKFYFVYLDNRIADAEN